ncbi:MAG: ATP-dependent DNA helicase RecG [Planctomycetes bacterium]|nr:ATP-dependent DNA helicase RecG [Planctomycetota bacterium]
MNPKIAILSDSAAPANEGKAASIAGVYPATAMLSSEQIARLIATNLEHMLALVKEWHTPQHMAARSLAPRRWSLEVLHRPRSDEDVAKAQRRLAYDELFLLQLATQIARRQRAECATAKALPSSDEIDRRIRARFPFALTGGQERAVREISADLAAPRPMNRMLQGDVGCGKTVVALYAALVAIANKMQVAIMAPTELLAEQHARSIEKYLAGSRVRHALLVGGMKAVDRREMVSSIAAGRLDLVVGTHALIQDDVQFDRLGLVVIDEQHRFGVRQRATIRNKGNTADGGMGPTPHYLVMSATPIPRTLAMTVFGDLDVTTIDELPPGRSAIHTRLVTPVMKPPAWEFIRQRLSAGEQAYVVYPLIDESDKIEAKAATVEFERLRDVEFRGHSLGLLHGRMSTEDREKVMADFAAGRIQMLVATTVIEVGIDVANATCMVVEHAERYGLSQLHQLRGRVGRGSKQGHCLLMTAGAHGVENERLSVLVKTTDGFRIAEEDLRIRGPGEMLGVRQHGLPELRVADLVRDAEILREAQRDAGDLIREDAQLRKPECSVIRTALVAKYGDRLRLMGAG